MAPEPRRKVLVGGRNGLMWLLLVLWTVALVEALTAGYFLLFAKTYYRPLYLEAPDDQWLWRTERDDWGAWHKPSSTAHQTGTCFSVDYRSNSYGARDREHSMTATARRAVVLGDSFMEGYAVDEDKRLSNLLETGLEFEMLNFGTVYAGPLQYQILYDRLARRFDHDLVIIGFLPDNDFIDNDAEINRKFRDWGTNYRPYYLNDGGVFYPRPRPGPDEPSPFGRFADLPERRGLLHNFYRLFWVYGLYRDIRYYVVVHQYPRPSSYLGYLETDPTRIAHAMQSIRAIQGLAAPRPVLVLFLPDFRSWSYMEKHPDAYDRSAVAAMRAAFERDGIRTIDLLKEFMRRRFDKLSLYLPCDSHWNNAGHHAAFEVVAPAVRDLMRSASRPPNARIRAFQAPSASSALTSMRKPR